MNDNSTKYPPPASGGSGGYPDDGLTDFHSLLESEAAKLSAPPVSQQPRARRAEATDFQSIKGSVESRQKPYQARTWTDLLIDFTTPFMILAMIAAPIFFVLDVRYVYTEVHDWNLRWFAFWFVLGVVALNRLIVRDGQEESMLYVLALLGVVILYTTMTTAAYDVGAVAKGYQLSGWAALALNTTIVAFIWWFTNRLTHECCVDDNPLAGDIGMLTSTAIKVRRAIASDAAPAQKKVALPDDLMEIDAVDPLDWEKPKRKAKAQLDAMSERLPKRHPGISIFYFSVPVMIVFALGQRVVQHGGPPMLLAGHFYIGCYTVAAMALLMLSSLAGLREYFRARRVRLPGTLGPFWVALGSVLIAMVGFGAVALPWPPLPPIAYVAEHEYDPWNRGSTFQLQSVVTPAVDVIQQNRVMERIGTVVLVIFGLFILYGALRAVGTAAVYAARYRQYCPQFVVRFFVWLEAFLDRVIRVPEMPRLRPRRRISRNVSQSAKLQNPLADASRSTAGAIEACYDALCALAYDYGVPRKQGQTPYEFVAAFPKELNSIREEAYELTDLYVVSAYSTLPIDDKIRDRLRKFWITFDKLRAAVVR